MLYSVQMDPEVKKILDEHSAKLDKIYRSSEKTRRYFFWTMMISIAVIVLPLIGLLFLLPKFLQAFTSAYAGLI